MTGNKIPRQRALVGLIALVAALLPLTGASAITGDNALQLSGDDNVARSIANSQVVYTPVTGTPTDPPTEALIGRADLFADNLASGVLQGGIANGRPLLLNDRTDGVNADVLAELDRLLGGSGTVHILGGLQAQGQGVEDDLADEGYDVNRFAGETRTETAIDIADAIGADTALLVRSTVASGSADPTQAFADALGAGALAATNDYSILFTQTSTLTESTADFLASGGGPSNVIIVGGELAVSENVETAVSDIIGRGNVSRVAGDTRFDTAVALNQLRSSATLGDFAIAVDGQASNAWTDGFTMANLSGSGNYPLVLTNGSNVPQGTENYLQSIAEDASAFANHFTDVRVVCGSTASDACEAVLAAAGGTGSVLDFPADVPDSACAGSVGLTDRPELAGATIGNLVTASQVTEANPIGLRVTFTFDEEVGTAAATDFTVHTAAGAGFQGTTATINDNQKTQVTVRFAGVATQLDVDSLTLATSGRNAVADFQNNFAVQGDCAIGTAGTTTTGAAGITTAPDVTLVDNFRQGATTTQTAVDVTFDENAWSQNGTSGNLRLIPADGSAAITNCTGPAGPAQTNAAGGTIAGGNGTTKLTFLCDNRGTPPGTTLLTPATFQRAIVVAGAVSDAAIGGNLNVSQAALLEGGSARSTGPDLIGGRLVLDASANGTPYDAAVFVFDNNIDTPVTSIAGLTTYDANRTVRSPLSTPAPQIAGGEVVVYFADGSLSASVGIQAAAGAVTDRGSPALQNRTDELGIANTVDANQVPGSTADPELTKVQVREAAQIVGSPTNVGVFTFDEDVDRTAASTTPSGFYLFLADGTAMAASSCSVGTTEETDNTVTCSAFTLSGTGTAATSAQIGAAVAGGVDAGAVKDDAGREGSSVGSAPVTT